MTHQEKVLIYSSVPRLFRTSYIGHLFDISQKYPTILLTEKLDTDSEKAIRNKHLFPRLEEIIPVDQYTGKKRSLFKSHLHFSKLMKSIINQYKPSIIIADSMINPLEKYLFRYGKESGAINVAFQAGFQMLSKEDESLWHHLQWRDSGSFHDNSFLNRIRLTHIKLQQHFNEIIDYWLYPMLMGTPPFFQKSLLKLGVGPGIYDVDYIVVYSPKEAELEKKIGRPKEAIKVLPHPLIRNTKRLFDTIYRSNTKTSNIITIMMDVNTVSHRRSDLSIIPKEEYIKGRIAIVKLLLDLLPGWKIVIKPHPIFAHGGIENLKKKFSHVSPKIKITDPNDPADKYINKSNIIIGFPPPSTTLFTSMLLNKLVIYVDLYREILGDAFTSYKGIKYAASLKDLRNIIIRYVDHKRRTRIHKNKKNLKSKDAADIIDEIVADNIHK